MNVTVSQLPNGKWQTRWRDRNRRQRAKNHRTKERALAHRQEVLREELSVAQGPQVSWDTFAEDWLERYAKVQNSPGTVVVATANVRNHLTPAFGSTHLADLRKVDLLDLRARLRQLGLSAKTANGIVSQARKMVETAVDWDILPSSPWSRVKPLPEPEKAFAYWTSAELERFLVFARRESPSFANVVAFAAHTGLRAGEIRALKGRDIDHVRRLVTVADTYCTKVKQDRGHTKGRRIRHVELNRHAYEAVADRRLIAPTQRVFEGFRTEGAARQLKRLAKAANVTAIRFHDLRHTFASLLVSRGVPLAHLQGLLGHKDAKQTQRYAHLMPDSLRGLTAVLELPVHDLLIREKPEVQVAENKGGKWSG